MPNDILDFEGLFEIFTPSQVDTAIRDLYKSFDSLYQANKANLYVRDEYRAFKKWADPVLKDNSITGPKYFASGTLTILERWEKRYGVAYSKAKYKAGPTPEAYDNYEEWYTKPYVWYVGGAIFIGLLIKSLVK